jgi:hypothetical protein
MKDSNNKKSQDINPKIIKNLMQEKFNQYPGISTEF